MADILDKMTKAEILLYIRKDCWCNFRLPSERWLKQQRYKCAVEKLKADMELEDKRRSSIDLKKRDEYARLFNEATDLEERLKYLALMEPYERELVDHWERREKLYKREARLDIIFKELYLAEE